MKQIQRQQLQQKLSPQQIQLMRLLQLPVTELEQAIKEEVEKNPLLEATSVEEDEYSAELNSQNNQSDWDIDEEEAEYDYHERLEADPNAVQHEVAISDKPTFAESLYEQLISRPLSERQQAIATELIGSIDNAGYLGRDLALISNDLAFRQGIDTTIEEVASVLNEIQQLEPAGIGARNLQECLSLQLHRIEPQDETTQLATEIIDHHFADYANHRYEQICDILGISQEQLEAASKTIKKLNPKPGETDNESDLAANIVVPDIILQQQDGNLQYYVNDGHLPKLGLNEYYMSLLQELEHDKGDKQTIQFLREKQADAQSFIDLLQQRHSTIVKVMNFLVQHQRNFLLTGNPDQLLPLRQREVAESTGLDISTVSRMANSKYIQTPFGTFPLKDCFSKAMADSNGNEVSVETIKQRLAEAIASEDKSNPLSDDAIAETLKGQGLPIARRTVAKYREQLGYPVARLRRTLLIILLIGLGIDCQAQMTYYDSIMNARLTAAIIPTETATKKEQSTQKKEPPKTPTQPTATKPTKAAPPQQKTAETELDRALVPMWYDAFPQHRVNPMGRTRLDMLPDEINIRLVNDTSEFCFPIKNAKTSNYGWRWQRGHHGVDILLNTGDPVHCAFGGIVRVAGVMGGYGNCIVVRHPNGLETLYGHLSQIKVKPYQKVDAGEVIGLGGSTGNSTGPHLHFEVRFLYQTFDPEWILDFSNFSLRTQRLHLDKSYFGIHQPHKGEALEYKADNSIIKESKKNRKSQSATYDRKDF